MFKPTTAGIVMVEVEGMTVKLDKARAVIEAAANRVEEDATTPTDKVMAEKSITLLHVADDILFSILAKCNDLIDRLNDDHRSQK